ncbi:MAG: lipoate--protein ligase family protein [Planctomycetota bacterium]
MRLFLVDGENALIRGESVRRFDDPAQHLAYDEALLRRCDDSVKNGEAQGFLRLWESDDLFVVLGVSGRIGDDVQVENCERDGVSIQRRGSGGGTVLQGPGCLNAAVVIPLPENSPLRDVHRSYEFFVNRLLEALGLDDGARKGGSDLTWRGLKFGGSAQKRTARAILHHSSLLWNFDLAQLPRYLKEPPKQPEYREERSHLDFVTNLPLERDEIRERLTSYWNAQRLPQDWTPPELSKLLEEKFAKRSWVERA